jgi:DNA mismatch repair protein MutL
LRRIHRLSETTVGQIAAGEVVERPAAVVKELLENAIDADATRVDIEVDEGGIERIQVRDDGAGISFEELDLAVERHATSKLSDIEDLRSISTLGFRGEALASIAAVSDLEVQSIRADESTGGEIRVRFGDVAKARPSAWGAGTSITMRRLFDNVPARREFLRAPRTEAAYIERVVAAHALAYPQIAMSLTIDGERVIVTDGRNDRIGAAAGVWDHQTASQMVELVEPDHMHDGYRLSGVVSLPSLSRTRRDRLFIFVQGRFVQSRQIAVAIEQAYHTLLMVGRRPLGCVLVSVPPDRIDVNVHPTKAEVRFADERLVFALVQRAVRMTLSTNVHLQPIQTVVNAPLGPRPNAFPGSQDAGVQRMIHLADPTRLSMASPAGVHAVDPLPEAAPGGRTLPVLRVLGQVAGMFVTAEGPDGLYLIDQHAAHERIMYERVMREYLSREPARQRLLEPVVLELSGQQLEMLELCQDDLLALGFEFDEFGAGAVAVRAIPAILARRSPSDALMTILDEMIEGGRGESRLESLAISAACHGSIRAGQPLSLLEMRELVSELERCDSSLACGHGRPTIIRMTAEELARQFARR